MECATFRVRHTAALVLVAFAFIVMSVASAAQAQEITIPHLRPIDARSGVLLTEGIRRSPVFRSLVERLDRSNVLVYVSYGMLPPGLAGQLTLLTTSEPWRYVRIDIDCRQSTAAQIAALAHELQHAVEVADAVSVDRDSMQLLFGRIGFATDIVRRRFETDAARATGARVRTELASPMDALAIR
jgi:hypothetical protein